MEIYAFCNMKSRRVDPIVDDIQLCLASARILGDRSGTYSAATIGRDFPLKLEFAANIYRLPEIIEGEASLLVSERVADVFVKHNACVKFLKADFSSAYHVPYELGCSGHEKYLDLNKNIPFSIIDDAMKRHQVCPPECQYYEVAMNRTGAADGVVFDYKRYRYKKEHHTDSSVELKISRDWVEEYKMYSCGSYVLQKDLFFDLVPYIPYGYFRQIKIGK